MACLCVLSVSRLVPTGPARSPLGCDPACWWDARDSIVSSAPRLEPWPVTRDPCGVSSWARRDLIGQALLRSGIHPGRWTWPSTKGGDVGLQGLLENIALVGLPVPKLAALHRAVPASFDCGSCT